jgi:hypothetical protein
MAGSQLEIDKITEVQISVLSKQSLERTQLMLMRGAHVVAAIVTPVDEAITRAQGLTADHVVLATTRETLDQLAARASDGRLNVQIATKFHPHQASRVFSAYAARSLAGSTSCKENTETRRGAVQYQRRPRSWERPRPSR